jgi:kynurenine formamidase
MRNVGESRPTEEEVHGYFESLSNWGRWGPDDQLGTLNLITDLKRAEAARVVRSGKAVGCSRPIAFERNAKDVEYPPLHFMIRSAEQSSGSVHDFLGLAPHGLTISHVDALAHVFRERRLYNGYSADSITAESGATVCNVGAMQHGIITRGVLVDIAGYRGVAHLEPREPIFPAEIEKVTRAAGVTVGQGDALLIRTGWSARRAAKGVDWGTPRERPGLHAGCLPWLHARGVSVIASDASQDVFPSGYEGIVLPIHEVGIVAMGLCLLDACQFDDLANLCRSEGRWEFMFVVAPVRYENATASPVNPIAIL